MRDPSSTCRKIEHATSSTTSGIEVDGIRYSSKRDASGFGDKASGARVAVHLNMRMMQLMYKLVSNIRTLKATHNYLSLIVHHPIRRSLGQDMVKYVT